MKKRHLIITAILLLITAVIAFFYLQGRRQTPEGSLAVICEDKETIVDPFTAPSVDVAGTVVNGKGQEKELSGKGVTLSDVLSLAGFGEGDYSEVRVVSSDEYAAQISAQEITSGKTVFLIKDHADNGSETIRLIVFGDPNAKRQVKNVVRIELTR